MKTTSILAFLGLVALTSCNANKFGTGEKLGIGTLQGTDETRTFLSAYSGKFEESDWHENLIISANGEISRLQIRQVGGGSSSQVPYPTACSFVSTGKISLVEKRDMADRPQYMDYATHVIEVQYNDIILTNELEPSTISNPNCQTFLTEMKSMIALRGSLQYSYYAELLSEDSFRIHTSGGGDYQHGGPRTPSTLDEVYKKVK